MAFGLETIAGPLISGALGLLGGERRNSAARSEASRQMEFQEEMSSTAYQRAVKDMRLAGINPMLAAKLGGASSPGGAMAEIEDSLSKGVSSASQGMQMQQAKQAMEQSQAQVDMIRAQAAKIRSETLEQDINSALAVARIGSIRMGTNVNFQRELTEIERAKLLAAQRGVAEVQLDRDNTSFSADVARRKAEARLKELDIGRAEAESKFWKSDAGANMPAIRALMEVVKGVMAGMGR